MENTKIRLIILSAVEDEKAVFGQQNQYLELTVAQIMSSLLQDSDINWRKKVGKTTSPFRYDLYQITYYAVEVVYRFKGLDLIDRVLEESWTEVHNIVQEAVTKTIPKKRNAKRQNGCLRKTYK